MRRFAPQALRRRGSSELDEEQLARLLTRRSGATEPATRTAPEQTIAPRRWSQLCEGNVVAEDCTLKLLQGEPWLDPEPLDEQAPSLPVTGARLGLATAAVEGEHQLASQLLAQRLRLDKPLELGNEPLVLADGKLGLDPPADHLEPQLGEPAESRRRRRQPAGTPRARTPARARAPRGRAAPGVLRPRLRGPTR